MTKRIHLLLLTLVAFAMQGWAQKFIDITLQDNTGVTYKVSDIKSIDFFEAGAPGCLQGRWFVGYRVSGSTSTPYKGKENYVFRGNQMAYNTATKQTIYNLEYAEDMMSFKAVPVTGTGTKTWTIVHQEPDLLVLKQSSYTWHLYRSAEAATTTPLEEFPARNEVTDPVKIISQYGSGRSNNANNPMGNHIAGRAKRATAEQKAWLEDPTTYPDQMDGKNYWVSKTVTLYPYGSPVPADVNQHGIGNCCLCAVLASIAYMYPDFIKDIIVKEGNNYRVKMYDPFGDPIEVCVNNKFLCSNSSGGTFQMTSKNDKYCWSSILEKAIMKWEYVYKCNGGNLGGIGTENAAPLLTGCGNSFAIDRKKLFNSEMKRVAEWAVENGHISIGGFGVGDLECGTEKSVTGHAFTLMYTSYPDEYLWTMRNPWGQSSTSKKVDGKLEIPNLRNVVKTIDFRIVEPGAAAPFLRADLGPYTPPSYIRRPTDTGVSQDILDKCGIKDWETFITPINDDQPFAIDEEEEE